MFITREVLATCGWQAFERMIARLLICRGFSGVRVVGGSGDKGADIIAISPDGKRWLVQAKYWARSVPEVEIRKTLDAAAIYKAAISVVVALNGVDAKARSFQRSMLEQGKVITIWDPEDLIVMTRQLPTAPKIRIAQGAYQEGAIAAVAEMLVNGTPLAGMAVMATGLGKTFTAAEAIRRARIVKPLKVLVLAHTNQLVLQLERAFWPFLSPSESTVIWNQHEKPNLDTLLATSTTFASRDSVANYLENGGEIVKWDLVLIDECHHAHTESASYQKIITTLGAGKCDGPMLLGLTATPFMASPTAMLAPVFGAHPLVNIDMIFGLKNGYLAQVDYRLFTDNINWESLSELDSTNISPRSINRVFFIREWDDGVINQLQSAWSELPNPKAIVFCGTIEHALAMRDKINSRGFCKAACIHSGMVRGESMTQHQRNLLLADFEAGKVNVVCTVDVFNEGIDVPDVNIVVFNRVTHSRRIFIQQLGRGLRLSPLKEKAIALDFAQDIRRYAAGFQMRSDLAVPTVGSTISIGNKVVFRNATGDDPRAESFLRAWLADVEAIEAAADDDIGILKFPPELAAR